VESEDKPVEHFHSLDVLRGFAALSVVFWHWQHFFMPYADEQSYEAEQFPLYKIFSVFYTKGWMAVDLFFGLSGFIFYWLYSNKIRTHQVSAPKFAFLRFSRLYPLHLATLVIVLVFQFAYKHYSDDYFIYQIGDVKRFAVSLLMIPSWKMIDGNLHYMFNGPAWSVSVEIVLYGLFFLYCRCFRIKAATTLSFAVLGFVAEEYLCIPLGRGIGSFFLGGSVFLVYAWLGRPRKTKWIRWILIMAAVSAWIFTLAAQRDLVSPIGWLSRNLLLPKPFHHFFHDYSSGLAKYWITCGVFPLTILAVANLEKYSGTLCKRVSLIGNISYSSYMLHFPIQLIVSTIVQARSIDCTVFFSGWFMLLFFAILVATSWASHRYFEMPMQRRLRRSDAIASWWSARCARRG
jgi:peptidoglycan/LPS O-acetylase OafA/YrhL